jgi:hypothetical protein
MAHATLVQPASKGGMHKRLAIYVPVKLIRPIAFELWKCGEII